jgi:cysteinyl-tRNA synthetase
LCIGQTHASLFSAYYEARLTAALDDDFNTPIALSILFELAKVVNAKRKKDSDQANALGQLLKKLGEFSQFISNLVG